MSRPACPRPWTTRPRWCRRLLAGEVEPALKQFEAKRLPVGRRIIERARHLGAYLQATRTREEQQRSDRHSNAEAVIRETATIDFLEA